MVDGSSAQAQYQTYLNACLAAMTEKVKEKKWPLCNRQQRSYYRSMFDILDTSRDIEAFIDIETFIRSLIDIIPSPDIDHVDVLPFKDLMDFLGTLKEGLVDLPEEKGVLEWFKSMDTDRVRHRSPST